MAETAIADVPEVAEAVLQQGEQSDDFKNEFDNPSDDGAQRSTPASSKDKATSGTPPPAAGAEPDATAGKPAESAPPAPDAEESEQEKLLRERAEALSKEGSGEQPPATKPEPKPAEPTARERELQTQLEQLRVQLDEIKGSKPTTIDPKTLLATEKILDALPDGDLKTEVSTVVTEYPDVMRAVIAIATAIAKNELPKGGDDKPLQEALAELKDRNSKMAYAMQRSTYWSEVSEGVVDEEGNFVEGHSAPRRIVQSKEFKEWEKQLPPVMKKVFESWNPLDGIRAISAFKEWKARQEKKTKDSALADKKAKKDGLLGGSLQSETGLRSTGSGKSTPESEKNEFDAEFDKAAREG